MQMLELMNRKAIGLGVVVYLVLLVLGLAIVGMDPSDTELQLVFWPAMGVGFAVSMFVVVRDAPDEDK